MYVIFPAADVVDESYFALVAQEQSEANPTGITSTSVRSDLNEQEARRKREIEEQFQQRIYHSTVQEQIEAEVRIKSVEPSLFEDEHLRSQIDALTGQTNNHLSIGGPSAALRALEAAQELFAVPDSGFQEPNPGLNNNAFFPSTSVPTRPQQSTVKVKPLSPLIPAEEPPLPLPPPPIRVPGPLSPSQYEYSGRSTVALMMAMTGGQDGAAGGGASFAVRDLIHPTLTEPLRQQQQTTFRLVKTGRTIKWEKEC